MNFHNFGIVHCLVKKMQWHHPSSCFLSELSGRQQQMLVLAGAIEQLGASWSAPTILRYDIAYAGLFKCSGRSIRAMPNLSGWLNEMMALPGVKATFDASAARASYYGLFPLNPSGIVPFGPTAQELDAEWSRLCDARAALGGGEPTLWMGTAEGKTAHDGAEASSP